MVISEELESKARYANKSKKRENDSLIATVYVWYVKAFGLHVGDYIYYRKKGLRDYYAAKIWKNRNSHRITIPKEYSKSNKICSGTNIEIKVEKEEKDVIN